MKPRRRLKKRKKVKLCLDIATVSSQLRVHLQKFNAQLSLEWQWRWVEVFFFFFVLQRQQDFLIVLFLKLKRLLFDFDSVSLKPIAPELLWLLVAQKSLACGWAALTVGWRLPYCGPTTFLPFKASSALSGLLRSQEHRAIAVAPPFLAHNSVTVINTSTDTVLSINNNIPVWPKIWCSGWWVNPWPIFMVPAPVELPLS